MSREVVGVNARVLAAGASATSGGGVMAVVIEPTRCLEREAMVEKVQWKKGRVRDRCLGGEAMIPGR